MMIKGYHQSQTHQITIANCHCHEKGIIVHSKQTYSLQVLGILTCWTDAAYLTQSLALIPMQVNWRYITSSPTYIDKRSSFIDALDYLYS
jgi:hypothetical protein